MSRLLILSFRGSRGPLSMSTELVPERCKRFHRQSWQYRLACMLLVRTKSIALPLLPKCGVAHATWETYRPNPPAEVWRFWREGCSYRISIFSDVRTTAATTDGGTRLSLRISCFVPAQTVAGDPLEIARPREMRTSCMRLTEGLTTFNHNSISVP